jgi:hypothetical protein
MGELLEPGSGVWCRQRWCRADSAREAEHFAGDGCSCHSDGAPEAEGAAAPELAARDGEDACAALRDAAAAAGPRLTVLTAKASRLAAFACRACGCRTRRMIEAPAMFFRCEECARADRWPARRRAQS